MLLLNLEQDMTDPRVAIVPDLNDAMAAAESMPHRVSFAFDGADGLLEPAINVGGADRRLTIKSLASVYREFSDKALERFESRQVAARRVAELLLSKFGPINSRSTQMEDTIEDTETNFNDDGQAGEGVAEAFTPTFGNRVTLLADPSKGIPEEHGVVTKVLDDVGFQVQVDPLYRVGEKDDGIRDALLEELGPDPVGTVRERPAGDTTPSGKTKKQISEEMKAKKAAEKAAAKAAKDEEKAAKAAAKAATRAERTSNVSPTDRVRIPDAATIKLVSETNPSREGSLRYQRFETYRTIGTVGAFRAAGGDVSRLAADQRRNIVTIGAAE